MGGRHGPRGARGAQTKMRALRKVGNRRGGGGVGVSGKKKSARMSTIDGGRANKALRDLRRAASDLSMLCSQKFSLALFDEEQRRAAAEGLGDISELQRAAAQVCLAIEDVDGECGEMLQRATGSLGKTQRQMQAASKRRRRERARDADAKAEQMAGGLYNPLRKGYPRRPMIFASYVRLSTRSAKENTPIKSCLAHAMGHACANARRCRFSHICPFCNGSECNNVFGYLKQHFGRSALMSRKVVDAPQEQVEITEEDTAALSGWAREEAARCVGPDGSLNDDRLRTVLLGTKERFARQLLSRLPYAELRALQNDPSKRKGLPASLLHQLLKGDVVNTALLAQDLHKRDVWLQRPMPVDGQVPAPMGAYLLDARPLLRVCGAQVARPIRRDLDEDEFRHPSVPASRTGGSLQMVKSIGVFKVLLSMFTHGISDSLPWESGLVLAGSACLACLALPEEIGTKWEGELSRATDLFCGVNASRLVVRQILGGSAGADRVASEIMRFVSPRAEARNILKPLAKDLYGDQSPYQGADVDLFCIGDSKDAAAAAFENARRRAVAWMRRWGDPPIAVRTLNSITLCGKYPLRHVQFVLRLVESVSELLAFADLDCTAFCYDGQTVWASERGLLSLELGHNLVGPRQICSPSDMSGRVAKYAHRGVGTLLYEVCRHEPRCDVNLDDRTRGKLKRVVELSQRPLRSVTFRSFDLEDAAHGAGRLLADDGYDEAHLPYGPSMTPAVLASFLEELSGRRPAGHIIPEGAPVAELAQPSGTSAWWATFLEWRRERRRALGNKWGLLSEDTRRCYMCRAAIPANTSEVSGLESTKSAVSGSIEKEVASAEEELFLRALADLDAKFEERARDQRTAPLLTSEQPSEKLNEAGDEAPSESAVREVAGGEVASKGTEDEAHIATSPAREATRIRRVPVCAKCAVLNESHRRDRENLSGCTAVVTGGRCKVGYQTCLQLLRCGAHVVASTRFPLCAAQRFLAESDSKQWQERLHIYAADFSSFPSLHAFAAQLASHYQVDVLVNNAAQTIRRPATYYRALLEEERAIAEGTGFSARAGLHARVLKRDLGADPWASTSSATDCADIPLALQGRSAETAAAAPLAASAAGPTGVLDAPVPPPPELQPGSALSPDASALFPSGMTDIHGEQLDLRLQTSWNATLASGGVESRELLEVLAVNACAPYVLVQQLLPALLRPPGKRHLGRFIVNVTSAEGMFGADGAAAKSSEHPHSNMAKAALNMLTKTAAKELGAQGVYVSAVDPGWVSLMRPPGSLATSSSSSRQLPPLSEADGAARVVAPILDGARALRAGSTPLYGVLFRNFKIAPW